MLKPIHIRAWLAFVETSTLDPIKQYLVMKKNLIWMVVTVIKSFGVIYGTGGNFGGRSVMTWAVFGYHGRSPLCFISCNMDAIMYVWLFYNVKKFIEITGFFSKTIPPFTKRTSPSTLLNSENIPVLEWPAKSPDFNRIKSSWRVLSAALFQKLRLVCHC